MVAMALATALRAEEGAGEAIDALFAKFAGYSSPGAAVVVVRDGRVTHLGGYGLANLEHGFPITPQTVFDVASVAKQVTGLAVATLVTEGRVAPEDDVRRYLPEVPDFGEVITLSHLIHHTSGLRDWPETLSFAGYPLDARISLETILGMVRLQRELDFRPGTEYLYSNTGYNLLAAVVQKVTGESLAAWAKDAIFEPLGMLHTEILVDPQKTVRHRADSYAPAAAGRWKRVRSGLAGVGSSSLFTTAEDLGRWLLSFDEVPVAGAKERVGSPARVRMHQPGRLRDGGKVGYGYGVGLDTYRGRDRVMHNGGWAGYRSVVLRLPELRFGVAILGNAANLDASALAEAICDEILGNELAPRPAKPEPPPTDAGADPSRWTAYPGTYALGPDWLLTITLEDRRLYAQATHESRFPARPLSNTEFHVDAYGASLRFVTNGAGIVEALQYRGIRAPLVSPDEPSEEELQVYRGRYWSRELEVMMTVALEDGRLWVRDPERGRMRLFVTGRDRFGTRQGRRLEFTRDAPGVRVVEVRVSGGRVRNLRFERAELDDQP